MKREQEKARGICATAGTAAEMSAGALGASTLLCALPAPHLSFGKRNDKGQRKDKIGNAVVKRIARRFLSFCPFVLFFRNLSACACMRVRMYIRATKSDLEKYFFEAFFEKKGQKDKGNAEKRIVKGVAVFVV